MIHILVEGLKGRKASCLAANTAVTEMPTQRANICLNKNVTLLLKLASHHVLGADPRFEPKMVLAGLT